MILTLLKKKVNQEIDYLDYVIFAGQSNMQGRVPYYYFNSPTYPYWQPTDNFKIYDVTSNSLVTYNPQSALPRFNGVINDGISWREIVIYDLYQQLQVPFIAICVAQGGTSCAVEWKKDSGSCYLLLRDRIRAFNSYAQSQGKVARCRALFWDQKEGDAGILARSENYVKLENSILTGNFIDFFNGIRIETGNQNLPIINTQEMTTQADAYAQNIINAQVLFDENYAHSYLIRCNENTARYPLQDSWHYNNIGLRNIGNDAVDIVIQNNILNDYRT